MKKEKKPVLDGAKAEARPDPEVDAKPHRRRFSAEYKLRILKEAEACREEGQTVCCCGAGIVRQAQLL